MCVSLTLFNIYSMTNAFERLTQAVEYLKDNGKIHTQQNIADELGISRSNLSQALKNNPRYFTNGFLRRFADAYSAYINKDWLLTGEGRMEVPGKDMRPHYPATVSAGFLGSVTEVTEQDIELMPKIAQIRKEYDFTILVEGDSMEPVFFDGDTLACHKLERGDELRPGKIYVIDSKEGAVVKTYLSQTATSIRLHSENPTYKNFSIAKSDIIGIAEVVGSVPADPQAAKEAFYKKLLDVAVNIIDNKSDILTPEDIVRQVMNNQTH